MAVSRWPASAAAEVSLVSKSPRGCVLCARKFALRGLVVGVSAKKFALRAQNGPKMVFSGVLGEFFYENTVVGAALGELCRGPAAAGSRRATRAPPAATYQPRTSSARAREVSHCLVPKEDTDTAATADRKSVV